MRFNHTGARLFKKNPCFLLWLFDQFTDTIYAIFATCLKFADRNIGRQINITVVDLTHGVQRHGPILLKSSRIFLQSGS